MPMRSGSSLGLSGDKMFLEVVVETRIVTVLASIIVEKLVQVGLRWRGNIAARPTLIEAVGVLCQRQSFPEFNQWARA